MAPLDARVNVVWRREFRAHYDVALHESGKGQRAGIDRLVRLESRPSWLDEISGSEESTATGPPLGGKTLSNDTPHSLRPTRGLAPLRRGVLVVLLVAGCTGEPLSTSDGSDGPEPGYPERLQLVGPPPASPSFVDVAALVGVYDLVPGWGLSWTDFDSDGDPDLFFSNHMHFPSSLYVNDGGLLFRKSPLALGIDVYRDDHAGVWADYDGDGDLDLYTANGFYRDDHLMRNDGGQGFTEVTAEARVDLGHRGRGWSALWGDFNGNGWDDLLVSNLQTPDLLYRNLTNGSFVEEAAAAGLSNSLAKMGAIAGDLDGDGDLDLYLPLMQLSRRNMLLLNRGNGTFVDGSEGSGADIPGGSMGCDLGEYDNDGDLDLYVTRWDASGDVLLRNRGDGTFEDVTAKAGIRVIGAGFRNAGFADLDNDGDLDLYVTRGGLKDEPNTSNVLLVNQGDGTFVDRTEAARAGALSKGNSASAAFADYDGDGFLDIAHTNGSGARTISGPQILLRNQGTARPDAAHWLRVEPNRATGSADGHGARVVLRLPDGRELTGESGRMRILAQDGPGVHFGLGTASWVEEISATWLDGSWTRLRGVPADEVVQVLARRVPRALASHAASLLSRIPGTDLGPIADRIAELRGSRELPEPDAAALADREDEVLAYALAEEVAAAVDVDSFALRAAYDSLRADFLLPERRWIEQVALGHFTLWWQAPPLPRGAADQVAAGLRDGRNPLDVAKEVHVRAWQRVFKEGFSGEPLRGDLDDEHRGYIEEGWLTPAMIRARYPELADELLAAPLGTVLGPVQSKEGRDVQPAEHVWPLLRVFRVEREQSKTVLGLELVQRELHRAVRRSRIRSALGEVGEPGGAAETHLGEDRGFIEGVPYDVRALATAARKLGISERPDVVAALDRVREELVLDQALLEVLEQPVDERALAARIAAREADWTSPERIRGTLLYFASESMARGVQRDFTIGHTLREILYAHAIPELAVRNARTNTVYYDAVVLDPGFSARALGKGSFEGLRRVPPGQASDVLQHDGDFFIVFVHERLPSEVMDPETARQVATRELQAEIRDRVLAEVFEDSAR